MNVKRRITAIVLVCSLIILIFGGQSPATVMADDTKIVESVNYSGPVSYTHLDVYKRQVILCQE